LCRSKTDVCLLCNFFFRGGKKFEKSEKNFETTLEKKEGKFRFFIFFSLVFTQTEVA